MATATCNKRDDNGPLRCELPKGHDSAHFASYQGGTVWWPNRSTVRQQLRRRSRIRTESDHHERAEDFTDGIKAAAISHQLEVYGCAYCVRCKRELSRVISTPIDLDHIEEYEAALAEAMANSAKHHVHGRVGHGYRPGKHGNYFGHDTPLLIEAPVCHDCHTGSASEIHPGPEFTRGVA